LIGAIHPGMVRDTLHRGWGSDGEARGDREIRFPEIGEQFY
jgi:hypothetical protein